jgi:hypothetical protein
VTSSYEPPPDQDLTRDTFTSSSGLKRMVSAQRRGAAKTRARQRLNCTPPKPSDPISRLSRLAD